MNVRYAVTCLIVSLNLSCVVLQDQGTVPPPHLIVVSPGEYIPEMKVFNVPEHDARDKLLPRGYKYCKCEEYHLGQCNASSGGGARGEIRGRGQG